MESRRTAGSWYRGRTKTIGVNDFRVLLADTINTLSELDEPLAEVEKKNDEGLQFLEIPITQVFDIVRGDGNILEAMYMNTLVSIHYILATHLDICSDRFL